jgi:hypothetical protein
VQIYFFLFMTVLRTPTGTSLAQPEEAVTRRWRHGDHSFRAKGNAFTEV